MTHATRLALTIALFFLLLAGAMAGGFYMVQYQISRSQAQWCDTIHLLTSHPVPKPSDPKANPSREQTYLFYENFLELKRRLGC